MTDQKNSSDLHLSHECEEKTIKSAAQSDPQPSSHLLYFSRRAVKTISDSMLNMTHLQCLYLEGNELSSLPEHFFSSLRSLIWLDLRNNQLSGLPAGIGQHRCLRTLLLEGNPLTELPAELGHVITLKALSLRNCPLTFPPQDVVELGLPKILHHLRSSMAGRRVSMRCSQTEVLTVEKLQLSELGRSSLDLCEEADDPELQRFQELRKRMIRMERADLGNSHSRTAGGDRGCRSHSLPAIRRNKEASRDVFTEIPPVLIQRNRTEERKLAAMKEMREKQHLFEEREKGTDPHRADSDRSAVIKQGCVQDSLIRGTDQELLQQWRNQARIKRGGLILEHSQRRRERERDVKDEDYFQEVKTLPCGHSERSSKVGLSDEDLTCTSHSCPQTPLQRLQREALCMEGRCLRCRQRADDLPPLRAECEVDLQQRFRTRMIQGRFSSSHREETDGRAAGN